MTDPTIVTVYRRILRAAERGTGVRLTAEEVRVMSIDQAVQQVVDTHDEEQEDANAKADRHR